MYFTADFETTVNENDCRVWAYGIYDIYNEYFYYGNNIDDFMSWCSKMDKIILYFHNLKFDGEFIIYWLLTHNFIHVNSKKEMKENSFTTLISDTGVFYSIDIKFRENTISIWDSLKILPFSIDKIAKGFNLDIKKLEIDYEQKRDIGHQLTETEIEYLKNDVMIAGKAIKTLLEQNLKKMTQGSNALFDFKEIIGKYKYEKLFPTLDFENDQDIRKSYKGGYTYLKPEYKNVDIGRGMVYDVNSLYPSVMYNEWLPYDHGIFFTGRYEPDKLYNLHIQMFTCEFELKENYLPTIQLKNNLCFVPTEYLTSSDGEVVPLCLTSVDLEIFYRHYHVYNETFLSGWKFKSSNTLFREYIDKWYKIKTESTINKNDAMRLLSKLMLNALYGKFALNPRVRSKIPYIDGNLIKYKTTEEELRKPNYIPVSSFITAYARAKTINTAQRVYDRFVYGDTDSLHIIGTQPPNIDIDPVKLGYWKHESNFEKARFLKQKCYIELIDDKLNVVSASLPHKCHKEVTWENFHPGLEFSGKLKPKRVPGGIILKNVPHQLK